MSATRNRSSTPHNKLWSVVHHFIGPLWPCPWEALTTINLLGDSVNLFYPLEKQSASLLHKKSHMRMNSLFRNLLNRNMYSLIIPNTSIIRNHRGGNWTQHLEIESLLYSPLYDAALSGSFRRICQPVKRGYNKTIRKLLNCYYGTRTHNSASSLNFNQLTTK